MTRTKLTNIVKLLTVCACVLLFILVCIIIFQYAKLSSLSSKNAELDKKIAELSLTEEELKVGIKKRSDPSYVEQQAREQLGMIDENGETVYVVK